MTYLLLILLLVEAGDCRHVERIGPHLRNFDTRQVLVAETGAKYWICG
jgi:hypothetical protein